MTNELDELRGLVSRWMVVLLWLHVILAGLGAWLSGNGWPEPCGAAALIAGMANAAWLSAPAAKSTRLTIAVAYIAEISIILAACRGGQMQIDIHMYYFAALAILAAYCDRDVILAGAAVTALHHLSLNFLAPALVFPDGGNFLRVVLHAVILIGEAAALVWLTQRINTLFTLSAGHLATARQASARAEQANAQAEAGRQAADAERQQAEQVRAETAKAQSEVVSALAQGLARLAAGELRQRLETAFPPEYENLRRDFNAAITQLQGTISSMLDFTRTIRSGSEEISTAADDLARRTEHQAGALSETATALDEVTGSVRKTAAGAAHAREVVAAARADTDRSGAVVAEAVEAMSGIDASSRQIGNIIGVIDEIAFQTNLLALNAGVEAARAGDAGRGFAVVATEVRALAQRSADAAKEIKSLIAASEAQVQAGVDRVARTGEVLVRLAAQVSEIDVIVNEISATAGQQANALTQVNEAVSKMGESTQQTAAMVEETTAASHELVGEVHKLAELGVHFDVQQQKPMPPMRRARHLATV